MDVTVVIPTRDRLHSVRVALASVCDFEHVIVVDDGSATPLSKQASLPGNIRILRNTSPRGAGAARNRGIEAATTQWICLLDDDDALLPGVAFHYGEAIRYHCEIVGWFGSTVGGGLTRRRCIRHKDLARRNALGGCSGAWLRRDIVSGIGGFDPTLASMQDWDLWLRLRDKGPLAYLGIRVMQRDLSGAGRITTDFDAKYRGLRRLYAKHRHRWSGDVRRFHLRRLRLLRWMRDERRRSELPYTLFARDPFVLYWYYRWRTKA